MEDYISQKFGKDLRDKSAEAEVVGTKKQLKQFSLSDINKIFGVPIVITDKPTNKQLKEKLEKTGKLWKE